MGFVEDDQVMGRQKVATGGKRGDIKVGVDDDHVGYGGSVSCRLGKAPVAGWAAGRPGALSGSDAHLGPGRGAGFPVQVGPVAGAGPRRPTHQSLYLPAERSQLSSGRLRPGQVWPQYELLI